MDPRLKKLYASRNLSAPTSATESAIERLYRKRGLAVPTPFQEAEGSVVAKPTPVPEWTDYPVEFAKSIPRGAAKTVTSASYGLVGLASEPYSPVGIFLNLIGKDDDVRAWAQSQNKVAQAAIQKAIPVTPGFEDSWTTAIGEGAGSLPVAVATGAVGGLPAVAAFGASAGYGATSANVLEMTGDPEAARKYGLLSAAVGGVTEPASAVLPTLKIFERINKASGGALLESLEETAKKAAVKQAGKVGAREFAEGAAREFITEAVQEMPDEAARQAYMKERTLLEGIAAVSRAGAVGGIVGAFVPALLVKGYQAHQKLTGKTPSPPDEGTLAPDETPPTITPEGESESFVGAPDPLAYVYPKRGPYNVRELDDGTAIIWDAKAGREVQTSPSQQEAQKLANEWNEAAVRFAEENIDRFDVIEDTPEAAQIVDTITGQTIGPPIPLQQARSFAADWNSPAKQSPGRQPPPKRRPTVTIDDDVPPPPPPAPSSTEAVLPGFQEQGPTPPPKPKTTKKPAPPSEPEAAPGKPVRVGEKVHYGKKIVANVLEIHPETGLITIGWFDEDGGHGIDVPPSALRSEAGQPVSIGQPTTTAPSTTPEIVAEPAPAGEQTAQVPPESQTAPERATSGLIPIESVSEEGATPPSGAMGITAPQAAMPGILAVDAVEKSLKHGYSVAKALWKHWGRARGDMPQKMFEANLDRVSNSKALIKEFKFGINGLTKLAKKLDDRGRALVNAVLQQQQPISALSPELQSEVAEVRQRLDQFSDLLIESGAASGTVVPIIMANKGAYLLRSYQAFDDPHYKFENIDPAVRNRYLALLAKENPGLSQERLMGLAEEVLEEARKAELPVNIFAKRHATPELRAFLGEHTNPIINATRTAARIAHVVTRHQYFQRLRADGWGKWFHPKPIVIPEGQPNAGKYITEIAGEDENWMRALGTDPTTGERTPVFTTPEIAAAMREQLNPKNAPTWLRWYMKAVALTQIGKAVQSPAAIIRDFGGNGIFFISQGNWRVGSTWQATKATFGNIFEKGSKATEDYVGKLVRLGVFDESVSANAFKEVAQEAMKGTLDDALGGILTRLYKKGTKGFVHAKAAVDNFWRALAFESEKADYRKAYPNLTESAVEKIAADRVRRSFPTWSLLPRIVSAIRRFPLGGDFISFTASVPLIFANTLDMIQQDLRNPATRGIGARRLIGLGVGLGFYEAIATGLRYLFGVSKEEDEAIRLFLPYWSANSTIAHFGNDAEGDPIYTDLGQVDPWQYLKRPFTAFMRGEDYKEATVNALIEGFRPYSQTRMLTRAILEVWANRNQSGRQIRNEQAPLTDQLVDVITHLSQPFNPGLGASAQRIVRGVKGEQSIYGQKFTWQNEVAAVATRITKFNRRQAFDMKLRATYDAINSAEGHVASTGARPGKITDQELENVYLTMNKSREELLLDAHKDVLAIMKLGMPRSDVVKILKAEGFSESERMAILTGNVKAWQPSNRFMQRIQARVDVTGGDSAEIKRRRRVIRQSASRERKRDVGSPVGK